MAWARVQWAVTLALVPVLLALCQQIPHLSPKPPLIIGATVGFVAVVESKEALAQVNIPQIRVEGRKGGSTVTAAIINALLILACEENS
jgi:precorrin-8X/cobalt-precorrin-8 methylmutase